MEEKTQQAPAADSKTELRQLFLDLGFWWKHLWSNWKIIVLVGFIGGVIGIVKAFLTDPEYKATVEFVVESSGGKSSNLGGLAAMAGMNLGGGGSDVFASDNVIDLYKSRTMITKALLSEPEEGRESLIDQYLRFNEVREGWEEHPKLQNLNFNGLEGKEHTYEQDSVLMRVVKNVKENYLKVDKPDQMKSKIVVEVQTKDEVFSKEFADKLVETVNTFYIETKTKKERLNYEVLQAQTDSVRAALNEAIKSTTYASEANPNPNIARKSLNIPMLTNQVDVEINKSIIQELVKNLELSKVALRREAPLIQIIDNPIYPLEIIRPSKIKSGLIGGIIAGFLIVGYLVAKEYYRQVMEE